MDKNTMKKLNDSIKRALTLRNCGMNCQHELDRLYTERDKVAKKKGKK